MSIHLEDRGVPAQLIGTMVKVLFGSTVVSHPTSHLTRHKFMITFFSVGAREGQRKSDSPKLRNDLWIENVKEQNTHTYRREGIRILSRN